ncbi:hypothetical protein K9L97_00325 [Candidatus Woesearchaeota archaeon]|nr:hypothetical protein [Candidatus Woesearchaeota archaeon]
MMNNSISNIVKVSVGAEGKFRPENVLRGKGLEVVYFNLQMSADLPSVRPDFSLAKTPKKVSYSNLDDFIDGNSMLFTEYYDGEKELNNLGVIDTWADNFIEKWGEKKFKEYGVQVWDLHGFRVSSTYKEGEARLFKCAPKNRSVWDSLSSKIYGVLKKENVQPKGMYLFDGKFIGHML